MVAEPQFDAWLLGRMQDGGMPHLGCEASCCQDARRLGVVEHPCSLGIRDRQSGSLLLIEATPAIEPQIAMLQKLAGGQRPPRRPVDAVMLTHAHIGHYAGLMHLGQEVAAVDGVPVHCTVRMAEFLKRNAPWSGAVEAGHIVLRAHDPGEVGAVEFEPLPGLKVEAVRVPHRDDYSDTVAFKVRGPSRTLLWAPDVDQWGRHEDLLDGLLADVDLAYLDATFFSEDECPGRDLTKIPHPFVGETMELLADRAAASPGTLRLMHFNHSNPVLHDPGLATSVVQRGFAIAEVGHCDPL